MAEIQLPNGTVIIDDSELMPNWQARQMLAEGSTPEDIATYLGEPLEAVHRYLAEGPYESPEEYWLRRYHNGTLDDEEE